MTDARDAGTTVATVRVGTSGWNYDDWKARFYPEGLGSGEWFDYYAQRFPTVEINYSFYRLPRESTVQGWHDQAPDRFRFAVKGSRYITHNLKLTRPEEPVHNVVVRMAPLKTFLGAWLWQLPPNLHKNVDHLDHFLGVLPGGARHAVEFRHSSWFDGEVEDVLRRHGAAQVWLSDRQMPDVTPVTTGFVYLRLHGLSPDEDERYRYDYSDDELAPWAERLGECADDGVDAWVYFNNDYDANAPRNAETLIEMLDEHAEPWRS